MVSSLIFFLLFLFLIKKKRKKSDRKKRSPNHSPGVGIVAGAVKEMVGYKKGGEHWLNGLTPLLAHLLQHIRAEAEKEQE